ncbi:hypothetical protein [Evansella cellulosilytica]|uniref:Uncharacterized protein n=1 Tax=Evansella cellulosilytica (strain ATCC 21833 / DSM 2522 / FERM P-1141 / JCM 9156 / N-4) TaxID=649639 RepID=E6U1I6_EVAC2|nr:hypothetical protein [Evansella cellulosilytica]ADU30349.1 hypothetical protein Bcell_2088 [Evansella cellulosilytica DSM 2522]
MKQNYRDIDMDLFVPLFNDLRKMSKLGLNKEDIELLIVHLENVNSPFEYIEEIRKRDQTKIKGCEDKGEVPFGWTIFTVEEKLQYINKLEKNKEKQLKNKKESLKKSLKCALDEQKEINEYLMELLEKE